MLQERDFNKKSFDVYPHLNKVREHVEKNISHPLALAEAASIAAMETKYFVRFFRFK
jgi:transcriptional regulator GlxA family with amidase domain